jgi:hypothetical protein
MARDTVTIALNGEVTLADFARAMQEFLQLMKALGSEAARGVPIEWWIEELDVGSASATARGVSEIESGALAVEHVVAAYENVGRALQKGEPSGYSQAVQTPASAIIKLIDNRIRSIRFETDQIDAEVYAAITPAKPKISEMSYGAVQGRIQSISNRGRLRFTIYRTLDDRPVSCYLEPGSEDMMREAWGRLATVEGLVRRDPLTWQPTTVRQVRKVEILPESRTGSWREALGAAPSPPGSMLPEEAVRRIRDD